ncbi:MAG: hypothetical protein JNK82_45090, partial [Myxococcaceae bacterium]|nr:hypothetical protein [Myxococcaceae bacterium]
MQTLVHLSDLHLGSARSVARARALLGELSGLGAATVVVTGDVTWGRHEQWALYQQLFASL